PYERGRIAVREGMKRAMKNNKFDINAPIDDPELEKMRQRHLKGYGATTPQMMREVLDKIDPDKQYSTSERNLMALGKVYEFYVEPGELGKAQEAAASMLQYYRSA